MSVGLVAFYLPDIGSNKITEDINVYILLTNCSSGFFFIILFLSIKYHMLSGRHLYDVRKMRYFCLSKISK